MAKIFGMFGTMSGKVADVVMVVRNGEQIARRYQPIVFNPSTQSQVAARAKLKLMSQLGAIFGPYIAMRKEGVVSARNLFVKANYRTATYANNQAEIELNAIKITKSVVSLPSVVITRAQDTITAVISSSTGNEILSRVVYVFFSKESDGSLRFYAQRVVNDSGVTNNFQSEIPATGKSIVVYAYGVRDNTENARVAFSDIEVLTAETIAKMIVNRTLTESDVTVTETQSATLQAGV